MSKIFKLDEINFDNINFLKSTKNKSDIIIPIYYKYNDKKLPLLLQVPSLYLNDSYNGKDAIILPLRGRTEQSTKNVCNFFYELDSTIISSLKKVLYDIKKENIYKLNFSNISYKSIVNEIEGDDNEIYNNGLIRYKLYDAKEFSTKIFDDNKNLLQSFEYNNKIVKGIFIKSIIEINSLVLRDNIIHVYIKPHQLRLMEEKLDVVNLENYSFFDSDDEEIKNNDSEIILNTQTDYLEPSKNFTDTEFCSNININKNISIDNKQSINEDKIDIQEYDQLCDSVNSEIHNHLLCNNIDDYDSESDEIDNLGNILESEINTLEDQ